ncbi:MAG: sensor histidine kinase [Solirubrobacterales bacterium]|nr:sensor histidine kinase [Solirubrobacterales bacterium]
MDPYVGLTRVPERPPRSDVLLVAALMIWALIEAVFDRGPGTVSLRILYALVITLPLLVRRRYPFAVVMILAASTLIWSFSANRSSPGVMPYPCLLLAIFTVALTERRTILAVLGGVIVLGVGAAAVWSPIYPGKPTPGNVIVLAFFASGAWAAGWLVRQRAAQARRATAESGELARAAVADERARIARELHDIVAHSVSIIAVQAGAAEELVDHDVDRARQHMSAVRRTAREAMTEMRRLLEVLRTEDAGYAPAPGLSRLPELLEDARSAGVTVELVEDGQRPPLPAGLELVIYRVVQESLTNVRKHSPGASVQVSLRYRQALLDIDVINTAPSINGKHAVATLAGAGHGLIGMRERVRLFGGSFEAGSIESGGFRIHARLPVAEEVR